MTKKTVPYEEFKKLKETYEEHLARKEEQIERLRKENLILLKTALKHSEDKIKLEETVKKRVEK